MRNPALRLFVLAILFTIPLLAQTGKSQSKSDQNAIVITFKDGHQQTFDLGDVAKIEFKTSTTQASQRGERAVFAGKWKVGTGAGPSTFYITLASDGTATKDMGAEHGKWEVVGAEARISWDDGWHDVIRRAGNHYEKAAWAPGRPFSDPPSNVTEARNTQPL
jgi:hypothetical protein